MTSEDFTRRFADRVQDYDRARPSYPIEVVVRLEDRWGLRPGRSDGAVADMGSGTGRFAASWLRRGHRVFGVEPNVAMAAAAVQRFANDPLFVDVRGRAEDVGLPSGSVDLVVAAQAFHWFDVAGSRREFLRILRPPAPVALVWNIRQTEASEFDRAYEVFLDRWGGEEYRRIQGRHADPGRLVGFFDEIPPPDRFEHDQSLDRVEFEARILSCSYLPGRDAAGFAPMQTAIEELFHRHAVGGRVTMHYETVCFSGSLATRFDPRRERGR